MGIALSRLKADGLIKRGIVLDIDLHYGDGTEEIFKNDDTVKVINVQASVPEAFISQTQEYLAETAPADIIGISAGFGQYEKDWGANLSTDNYREIGFKSGDFARKKTGGKIFLLLEGGYYIPDLGGNALALLEGVMEGLS
jgi:acetoin utilization deacetylase AcuC-like enzyme